MKHVPGTREEAVSAVASQGGGRREGTAPEKQEQSAWQEPPGTGDARPQKGPGGDAWAAAPWSPSRGTRPTAFPGNLVGARGPSRGRVTDPPGTMPVAGVWPRP